MRAVQNGTINSWRLAAWLRRCSPLLTTATSRTPYPLSQQSLAEFLLDSPRTPAQNTRSIMVSLSPPLLPCGALGWAYAQIRSPGRLSLNFYPAGPERAAIAMMPVKLFLVSIVCTSTTQLGIQLTQYRDVGRVAVTLICPHHNGCRSSHRAISAPHVPKSGCVNKPCRQVHGVLPWLPIRMLRRELLPAHIIARSGHRLFRSFDPLLHGPPSTGCPSLSSFSIPSPFRLHPGPCRLCLPACLSVSRHQDSCATCLHVSILG